MNFNKCERCGCFFSTDNSTCPSCSTKDNMEMHTLKNYLITNSISENISTNVSSISYETGISIKNLNRFLHDKNFSKGIDAIIKENNNKINL